ncbi:hypothetical protein C0992_011455 [Termitomyces sp. T32_za158]|nr:hypothetical protein C0992_007717 [Termitomyces sp. T32_za158]KAG6882514.1 hypothetical protein C0992_011455 [Termitomyces sp. T32_za158]
MRERVGKDKLNWAIKFAKEHENTIKDYNFKPRDLVLVRNTAVEKLLSSKMTARYLGPMVVVARTQGGSYVLAELDGTVWHERVAAFRVIPYKARKKLVLSTTLEEWIDIGAKKLADLKQETKEPSLVELGWEDEEGSANSGLK